MIARLKAVKEYLEMSFINDTELENLVFLASEICQTPIASISLVDDQKQYSIIGKGQAVNSDCNIAFCSYTIQQEKLLEVPNALEDERFINNPLVTQNPHIRFYAGVPLVTSDKHTIGSLCVIDHVAKKLTSGQIKSLEILAGQIMARLELKLSMKNLTQSISELEDHKELMEHEQMFNQLFQSNYENFFLLLDKNFRIVRFNDNLKAHFQKSLGFTIVKGVNIIDHIRPLYAEVYHRAFAEAKNGKTHTFELLIDENTELARWVKISIAPAYNRRKELIGFVCIGSNITDEKLQQEKIVLQDAILSQIAQIHSHQIRHPLTNILGIIHLIKQEGFKVTSQYIEYLEKASKELDDVIRKVVFTTAKINEN